MNDMIKSSMMNVVREKAKEAADWIELHTQLKALAAVDIEGEKKKLAAVRGDRYRAEAALKAAQQSADAKSIEVGDLVTEARRLKKEAEDMVTAATQRAAEIILDANRRAKAELESWVTSIESHRKDLDIVRADLAKADGDLFSKQKEHAELEKQHEDLVRKHSTLLGALAAMKSSL